MSTFLLRSNAERPERTKALGMSKSRKSFAILEEPSKEMVTPASKDALVCIAMVKSGMVCRLYETDTLLGGKTSGPLT
jgi:hypothetical protein